MAQFVTVDLNGWLDHLVVGEEDSDREIVGGATTLGFRSCLYRHEGTWLFGSQALAAARDARAEAPLLDAIDALTFAAGHGKCPPDQRYALPDALWQLVSDVSRRPNSRAHLAMVVPDGRYLGRPAVNSKTGQTRLETLHSTFLERRPRELNQSRFELIWRSVAALEAARTKSSAEFPDRIGSAMVISVNRRTFWTVSGLSHWPAGGDASGAICIVRKSVMDDCDEDESWSAQRVKFVQAALRAQNPDKFDAIRKWTRFVEILASGMRSESLLAFGMEEDAIEHWSWPVPHGNWEFLRERPSTPIETWPLTALPPRLDEQLRSFAAGREGSPIAVVIESPVGEEMTLDFKRLVQESASDIPIVSVTGRNTANAALDLALALGRDRNAPAWLDAVPSIELKVRQRPTDAPDMETLTTWKPVVAADQVIPAGETYHTPSNANERAVTLAPGVEHIHLHLRRGSEPTWDERYSGQHTGHIILASDHERTVEPLARVRPLSGEARIEIVEHFPDGRTELLAGSRSSVRWSEMSADAPAALRSIPELYVFRTSEEGWRKLYPLLKEVVAAGAGSVGFPLKERLYTSISAQWRERVFPLGSDGQPPRVGSPSDFRDSKRLLAASTAILLQDLEDSVHRQLNLSIKKANRLHLPLTWLFTGCPEKAIDLLLDALIDPQGTVGRTLHVNDNEYSAWSIYQGIGRAARSDAALTTIFDDLLWGWERDGGTAQDKFLLAAVTHPLARRVSVRSILGENRERFDRAHRFLAKQLHNLVRRASDSRPGGQRQQSLELRYITMGYRGLCQLRYSHEDWFLPTGEKARWAYDNLLRAKVFGKPFEQNLVDRTAPYLIGEGRDPTMPGGF